MGGIEAKTAILASTSRMTVPINNLSHRWNCMPFFKYSDPANRKRESFPSEYLRTLSHQNFIHVTGFFENRAAIIDQLVTELLPMRKG